MSHDVRDTKAYKRSVQLGCLFMFLAAVLYTLMNLFVKIIGKDASLATIVFFRFVVSLGLVIPSFIKHKQEIWQFHIAKKLIVRSCLSFVGILIFFFSLRFLPLADAQLYINTTPLFIPLIIWLIYRFSTPLYVWLSILLGFIGVALVLQVHQKLMNPAAFLALFAGLLNAITFTMIRRLSKLCSPLAIMFYTFLFCTILGLLLLPFDFKAFDSRILAYLIVAGVFGALYQLALTWALAKAASRITAPIMFICIIFGAFADYFVWHRLPDIQKVIGMILVVVGGGLTIILGHRNRL